MDANMVARYWTGVVSRLASREGPTFEVVDGDARGAYARAKAWADREGGGAYVSEVLTPEHHAHARIVYEVPRRGVCRG